MTRKFEEDMDPSADLSERLLGLIHDSEEDDAQAAIALVQQGADPNSYVEQHNSTPLIEAVTFNRLRIAEALLKNGGQVDKTLEREASEPPSGFSMLCTRPFSPRIWVAAFFIGLMNLIQRTLPTYDLDLGEICVEEECSSKAMARLLVSHGADPVKIDAELRPAAFGADLIEAQEITRDVFQAHSRPRAGTANPELCDNPFYLEQFRTGRSGYAAGRAALGEKYSSLDWGPVWSFDRFGQTATRLPDGRLVVIGGEHEDSYDPDFNIYNDVTVFDGIGGVKHFLYPEASFPPTDFHTATLMEDHILLIGSLSNKDRRPEGQTQVLRLNLSDFSVEPVVTTGDNPGWINRHRAERTGRDIRVWGGKVEPGYTDLQGRFALDTETLVWRRLE